MAPAPLTHAERRYFFTFLEIVAPHEAETRQVELEHLLLELAKRFIDLHYVLQVIRSGAFAVAIERQDGAFLTKFRQWLRKRNRLRHALQQLPRPDELEQLYRQFPPFISTLDKQGRLPTEPEATAWATLQALEALQAAIAADPWLNLTGTGRARGRQPVKAAAQARTLLKKAGLSGEQVDLLLQIYDITRPRSS